MGEARKVLLYSVTLTRSRNKVLWRLGWSMSCMRALKLEDLVSKWCWESPSPTDGLHLQQKIALLHEPVTLLKDTL
jgi:hypothetical protein